MIKLIVKFLSIFTLVACSNAPEFETGEIKTFQVLRDAIFKSNSTQVFMDARTLLSRDQVDAAKVAVLFVELNSGQNGTLTPYPGQGVAQTWLGADGATITLDQGILKASRGMGDDLMGASSSMPKWLKLNRFNKQYSRKLNYLSGDNKIRSIVFKCEIKKMDKTEVIKIWQVPFHVTKYNESCFQNGKKINNTYYLDNREIVRRSIQYHSETIGYILIERLDR